MNAKMMILVGLVLASLLVLGCAKTDVAEEENVQLANPASQNCVDLGGTLRILDGENGQFGICTLPDGTECEEWALFRGYCGKDCEEWVCPEYMMPAPGWCDGGTIVSSGLDECGCDLGPRCIEATEASHVCSAEEKAATMCTMEYAPVCGTDGVTYGNKCGACAAGVDSWVYGECPTKGEVVPDAFHRCTVEEKANQACTRDYNPVCGDDGKTYSNGCTACAAKVTSWLPGECPK